MMPYCDAKVLLRIKNILGYDFWIVPPEKEDDVNESN